MLITNNDSCPHCRTIISILNANYSSIKSWSYSNAFAMKPVIFTLKSKESRIGNLKGYLKGFIVKIWEWQKNSLKISPFTRVFRRSVPSHNETYHINEVTESIMLITFQENDVQIINVSMIDIYLICNGPGHSNCQPDYQEQENSLLIADLDHDDSIELISYYSTYVNKKENGYDYWHLVSKLKVFRLESELPTLFAKH